MTTQITVTGSDEPNKFDLREENKMKNYQRRHYEEFYLMLSDGSSIS